MRETIIVKAANLRFREENDNKEMLKLKIATGPGPGSGKYAVLTRNSPLPDALRVVGL